MALADLADDRGVIRASVDEIAERTACGTATTKRAIATLVGADAISRHRNGVGNRMPTVTVLAPKNPQASRRPMKAIPADLWEDQCFFRTHLVL